MDAFRIQGHTRLAGEISVDGSKNAALPHMAAAILSDGEVTLRRVPDLSDVRHMAGLLRELGCSVRHDAGTLAIGVEDADRSHARYELMRQMRAGICVLGPLLARRGEARVSMPGGCAFGDRPVDLHLRGLEAMGARIQLSEGNIVATADALTGATIFLGGPFGSTVLGTSNVMSAATLARGTTVIESSACEPEIISLAAMLNAMGARISGAGTPRITIEGVERLGGAEHDLPPDRIVAGTWIIAAVLGHGDVIVHDFPRDHLLAFLDVLGRIGVRVEQLDEREDPRCCSVRVISEWPLKPAVFTTQPYPGFPTDLQAQLMTLLCFARGNSIVTEKIYPERFMHVPELTRMGARLTRQGQTVVVQGPTQLVGAPVMASDLRASAGLVLAGLAAHGETTVHRVYHLDRGYARMDLVLEKLGARIERFEMPPDGVAPHRPEPPMVETPTAPRHHVAAAAHRAYTARRV